jgi:hypothetical protein
MFIGGNLVSWKIKKQLIVTRSAEAEYRAMTLGVAEMLWLNGLLINLKLDQGAQMKLWCDNKLTIIIVNNSVQHNITKHVKIG